MGVLLVRLRIANGYGISAQTEVGEAPHFAPCCSPHPSRKIARSQFGGHFCTTTTDVALADACFACASYVPTQRARVCVCVRSRWGGGFRASLFAHFLIRSSNGFPHPSGPLPPVCPDPKLCQPPSHDHHRHHQRHHWWCAVVVIVNSRTHFFHLFFFSRRPTTHLEATTWQKKTASSYAHFMRALVCIRACVYATRYAVFAIMEIRCLGGCVRKNRGKGKACSKFASSSCFARFLANLPNHQSSANECSGVRASGRAFFAVAVRARMIRRSAQKGTRVWVSFCEQNFACGRQ